MMNVNQVTSKYKEKNLTLQKFIVDIIVRLFTQIILRLRSLIFLPLIAKSMGAMEYAVWVQVMVTLNLLVPIAMLRLETAVVRYLSAKSGKSVANDFFSMLFLIWGFLIMIFVIAIFFKEQIANFLFGDPSKILYIELLFIMLFVRTNLVFLCSYYQAFLHIKRYSVVELAVTFAALGIALFFVLSGKGLVEVFFALIIVETVAAFLVFIDIFRLTGFPNRFKMKNLYSYLRYSIPLIPNVLLYWVIDSSDRYLIVHMLDLKQVGIYSASYALGQLAIFFLTPISFVLFPTISKFWNEGKIFEVKRYMQNSLKYYLLLSVPSVFGIYYFAPFILKALATEEFVTDRLLVLFIVLGFFCVGVYQIYLYIIHLKEKTRYLPFIFLMIAALNLGLNLVLIPKLGIMGAAFSTFLAYFVQMLIIMIFSAKLFWIGFDFNFFGKTIAASVCMFLFLKIFNPSNLAILVVVMILGIIIYLALMIIMKGIGREEWKLLKMILESGGSLCMMKRNR